MFDTLLLPGDYFDRHHADEHFRPEEDWAREHDITVAFVDTVEAPMKVRGQLHGHVLYRGWMMNIDEYEQMQHLVQHGGGQLVTDTAQYRHAHHLPQWYEQLAAWTPHSVWGPQDTDKELLHQIGDGAAVVKDYVKSLKGYWEEAAYIPDVQDSQRAQQVIDRFRELRDVDLQEGIVLRSFEPISTEVRSWWKNGQPFLVSAHPDTPEDTVTPDQLPLQEVQPLIATLNCPFITVDWALRDDGQWRIMEIGDGGVSDRPTTLTADTFYSAFTGE